MTLRKIKNLLNWSVTAERATRERLAVRLQPTERQRLESLVFQARECQLSVVFSARIVFSVQHSIRILLGFKCCRAGCWQAGCWHTKN